MSTKLLWRLLLGLTIIMTAGGCSSVFDSKAKGNYATPSTDGPTFSLSVGGKELAGSSDRLLSGAYRKGITIMELLKGSGVAMFAEDGKSILSVSNVSLGPELEWELQVDGKAVDNTDWNQTVNAGAHLVITAKQKSGDMNLQSVFLFVNGGSEQEELTHSYVMHFTEALSVRSLLKGCGMIQLSEDNQRIVSVKNHLPLTNEVWNLKVNGKKLMDNGMDMKLRPQDELEVTLTLR